MQILDLRIYMNFPSIQFSKYLHFSNWVMVSTVIVGGGAIFLRGRSFSEVNSWKKLALIPHLPQLGYLFNPAIDFYLSSSSITVSTASSRHSIEMVAFITARLLHSR